MSWVRHQGPLAWDFGHWLGSVRRVAWDTAGHETENKNERHKKFR